MKKEVKILLDIYSIIGESLFEIVERPQVVRNRFGGLMVELKNILASHGVAVGPVTPYNIGSQKCLCETCKNDKCDGMYNKLNCHVEFTVTKCDGFSGRTAEAAVKNEAETCNR